MKNNKFISIIILLVSLVFYILGIYFPLLATKSKAFSIVFKYTEVRLFDSIRLFMDEKDYLLALIIFVFTFLFPVVKYITLFIEILKPKLLSVNTTNFLHKLDKWSMIDVFLVALLLLNFKLNSSFIVMGIKIGTHFIALSVVFRMLAVYFVGRKSIFVK